MRNLQKVEAITETFYAYLDEDKIMGKKCPKCGTISFWPVAICNECGCDHMDWVELEGTGEIIGMTVDPAPNTTWGDFDRPVAGYIHLDEGPTFYTWIVGMTPEEAMDEFQNLPIRVKLETQEREGKDNNGEVVKFKYPVARVVR